MTGFRFHHVETVRWVDMDAMGVLNNAVYLTLLEQARLAYFAELGVMRGAAFPFVLGETTVRYEKPALAGMQLRIDARVTRLGNKSFAMEYEIHHGDDRLATARATLVYVDPQLRSAVIPDDFRAALANREGIPLRSSNA